MAETKPDQSSEQGAQDDECCWEVDWKSPELSWHVKEVHTMLLKHEAKVTGGRANLKVLVPLCGISVDLLWFANRGHSVVGIEYDAKGCQAFFEINNLAFDTEPLSDEYKVFKGKNKDITLFQCDFFKFPSLVPSMKSSFDVIWDRAAIRTTVEEPEGSDAKAYLSVLRQLVAPGGKLALENTRFNIKDCTSPHYPGVVSDEMVENLGKEAWNVSKVDQIDYEKGEGIEPFYSEFKHDIALHFLTPK